MSTIEGLQPLDGPERQVVDGQIHDGPPEQRGAPLQEQASGGEEGSYFQDPTPTAELPVQEPAEPARSLRELLRNRATRVAATVTGGALTVGLIAMGAGRNEAVAGTPVGSGHSDETSKIVPGGEQAVTPEVVKRNLCDVVNIEDLAEWTTGSRYAFPPKEQIECSGEVPPSDDLAVETIAVGTWRFPQTGPSSYPVDYIRMQVVKDTLPDGSSFFQQRQRTFSGDVQTHMIGKTEVSTVSASGTTLVNVSGPEAKDLIFTIKLPPGLGGESQEPTVYDPIHAAEIDAMPQLGPQLGLIPRS